MWLWEHANWSEFLWDHDAFAEKLRHFHFKQGLMLGKVVSQSDDQLATMLDNLLANIVNSCAIEGEFLNAFSVRSSLANKLGIAENKPFPTTKETDGLAEIMLDVVENSDSDLTLKRVLRWHELLFPADSEALFSKIVGGKIRATRPMQVVSGRLDKPKVHFEAPPHNLLQAELARFFVWFNQSKQQKSLDPIIRAAIAHLWFVTIHPFEEGNGRLTRSITDLALAQGDKQSIRFYSMSVSLLENRKSYYQILEATQRGDKDITAWISWFIDMLDLTVGNVIAQVDQTLFKTQYWRQRNQSLLTPDQAKVLNRMLDGDFELGINAAQYAKVAKVSRATATRHLTFLAENNFVKKSLAGGRSTRYLLIYVSDQIK